MLIKWIITFCFVSFAGMLASTLKNYARGAKGHLFGLTFCNRCGHVLGDYIWEAKTKQNF